MYDLKLLSYNIPKNAQTRKNPKLAFDSRNEESISMINEMRYDLWFFNPRTYYSYLCEAAMLKLVPVRMFFLRVVGPKGFGFLVVQCDYDWLCIRPVLE